MKKKILVTGAAGFIGSFLCERLVAQGHHVLGMDNFFRGRRENLCSLIQQDFVLEEVDLSVSDNIPRIHALLLAHQIEQVVHLAAINGTQYFYDRPFFVLDQNICITQNLLAAIQDTSVRSIVYTSSSEVYGDPMQLPTPETHPIQLNALADRDSYAASKAIDEFYIRLFAKQNQLDCLILRVFNLYGERMVGTRYGQVIPEFIQRLLHEKQFTLLGDGHHTRSFCYIEDAITLICKLMEKRQTGLFNLGNDAEISILELAKILHDLDHRAFEPVFLPERLNDHQRRRPDLQQLKSILADLHFTPLHTGLQKVLDYYRSEIK